MEPVRLTPRQREGLELLVKRRSNQEIADNLGISLDGAKWHVREVLQIYGVDSREEAAERYRVEHGLPRRLWRMTGTAVAIGAIAGCAAVVALAAFIALSLRDGTEDGLPSQSGLPSATVISTVVSSVTPAGTRIALTPTQEGTTRFLTPSRASGDVFIDYLTAKLESGVPLQLEDFSGQSLPCSEETFITAPACGPGQTVGTLVYSIITFQCEIGWNALTADVAPTLAADRLTLHSVLRGGSGYTRPPAAPARPDYWVLYTNSAASLPPGFAVAVKDGKVVSFGRSCGTFESLVERLSVGSGGYLVAPP